MLLEERHGVQPAAAALGAGTPCAWKRACRSTATRSTRRPTRSRLASAVVKLAKGEFAGSKALGAIAEGVECA